MEHNYQPLLVLLGAVVRHFLTLAGGALLAYGVTQEQLDAAVDSSVTIIVAVVMTLIALGWSYVAKKAAFETPTTEEK